MSAELERIEDLTTSPPSVFFRPADSEVTVGWRPVSTEAAAINYRRLLQLHFSPDKTPAESE